MKSNFFKKLFQRHKKENERKHADDTLPSYWPTLAYQYYPSPAANDKFYDQLNAKNQNIYNSDDEFDQMSDSDESYTTGVGAKERKGTVQKLYHVSTDLRPIHSDDGYDSEVELDPYWLNDYMTTHNDEFQDLNYGEKIIMESWSLYKKKHAYAAGNQVLETCVDWLESDGEKIVQSGSINNCITHFVRMMKGNELNRDELEDLISLLRDTYRRVNTTKSTQPIITCSNSNILENERTVCEKMKCSSSTELRLNRPEYRCQLDTPSTSSNKSATISSNVSLRRYGPAPYWYDKMAVSETGQGFDLTTYCLLAWNSSFLARLGGTFDCNATMRIPRPRLLRSGSVDQSTKTETRKTVADVHNTRKLHRQARKKRANTYSGPVLESISE